MLLRRRKDHIARREKRAGSDEYVADRASHEDESYRIRDQDLSGTN